MTSRTVDLLDTAIGNVKNARESLRHDNAIQGDKIVVLEKELAETKSRLDQLAEKFKEI